MTLVLLALVWSDLPWRSDDSDWYLLMAGGHPENVPAPFAGRLVHTGLARLLAATGLDLEWAFLVEAAVSIWFTLAVVVFLLRRGGVHVAVTVAVVATWFTDYELRDATLPDAHAAAWLALLLLALSWRPIWALAVIPVAMLCRESLALLVAVLAVLAWRRGWRLLALGSAAAAAAGLLAASRLADAADVHALGGPLYVSLKFAFNLSRNLLGCELWVPTIEYCEPARVWTLPTWAPTGSVREIGICGFNPQRPLWLLVAWSTDFGVAPGWLWARRRTVRDAWTRAPLWLQAALAYGLAALVVAPAAGTVLTRMVGYAWPAFWLATPLLAGRPAATTRGWWWLGLLHLAAGWAAPLLADWRPETTPVLVLAAMLGVGCNVWTARRIGA